MLGERCPKAWRVFGRGVRCARAVDTSCIFSAPQFYIIIHILSGRLNASLSFSALNLCLLLPHLHLLLNVQLYLLLPH